MTPSSLLPRRVRRAAARARTGAWGTRCDGNTVVAVACVRRAAYEHLARAAGREADLPPSWEMHDAGRGHRCIVVDELWARSLCAVEHVELCPAFNGVLLEKTP